MRIGIDFGTSYSAAGAVIDGQLELVRFGDAQQFRTTAYFPQALPDASRFELTPALEAEVDALVRASRAEQARVAARARERAEASAGPAIPFVARSEAQLRRDALLLVRRHWLEAEMTRARQSVAELQNAVYGDAAIEAYLAEGDGHLVVSPKSMLGYKLHGAARDVLVGIALHILEHIRVTASEQFGVPVREAVLGRPVEFRSSMGAAGGEQAIELLTEAARGAGFDRVTFLEEPAAAAFGYHRELRSTQRTLVVDIGGGTTDIAAADVGGEADAPRVHGAWGIAQGGTDVDLALSMRRFMPLFGKDHTRTPVHHYYEAAAVHDLQRQQAFRARVGFGDVPSPFGERLITLQEPGNTVRLQRDVEDAKIALSTQPQHEALLDYIEPGLRAACVGEDLTRGADAYLRAFSALLVDVRSRLDRLPDTVFLTGGMSRGPYIRRVVADVFPEAEAVHGNASLGVVSGLAAAAGGGDR
ncbi:Hsp70 family protein [Lysobacter korlensis]|uniref:Hsp70 family protein n=1 Tax=Lysobacter korlensis TaxID=553636 RepID=A0ABV6RQZ4_9GAMM